MIKPLTGRYILIVDDSLSSDAWAHFLTQLGGAQTMVIDTGSAALEQFGCVENQLPDLVLLDFELLDNITGSQIADELRTNERLQHVVRVSFSSHRQAVVLEGFSDPDTLYHASIDKPVSPQGLVSAVAALLASH